MISLTSEITIYFSALAKKPQIIKVKANIKKNAQYTKKKL